MPKIETDVHLNVSQKVAVRVLESTTSLKKWLLEGKKLVTAGFRKEVPYGHSALSV
jgi:hypothetical protein